MNTFNPDAHTMKITIQSPGYNTTKRLEGFIGKSLEKLNKFYLPVAEAHVILRTDNANAAMNRSVDIRLVVPGNDLFASKTAETFDRAVKLCVDALKRQIERQRTLWDNQRVAKSQ